MPNRKAKVVTWQQARKKMMRVNPELAELIDDCIIPERHKFLEVDYLFGDYVLKDGEFYIPSKNGNEKFSKNGYDGVLDYDWINIPFGILLEGFASSCWQNFYQSIPKGGINPGKTCGLLNLLLREDDYIFRRIWVLSIGSMMLCQLASVNEQRSFKRLAKYFNVKLSIPNSINQHWDLFSKVSNSMRFHTDWKTRILFFSKAWVEDIRGSNKRYDELREYLKAIRWRATAFNRAENMINFVWDNFVSIASDRKEFKGKSHIFDAAKHVILIACGGEFGYAPASIGNHIGPIKEFAQVLLDIYKTKHCPTFIYPFRLKNKGDIAYHSLQYGNYLSSSPRHIARRNNKEDLADIKYLLELFFEQIIEGNKLQVEGAILEQLPEKVNLQYFHPETNYQNICKHPREILKSDERFLYKKMADFLVEDFAASNLFFNGCIQIKLV